MLITRNLTKDKRPVVDFRLLNTKILRQNISIPLMSEVLNILGNCECKVLSCLDIKVPFGSPIYRYEVLPMGIACAPQIWMHYFSMIIGSLDHNSKYITIMDVPLIYLYKERSLDSVGRFVKSHDNTWPQAESKEMSVI